SLRRVGEPIRPTIYKRICLHRLKRPRQLKFCHTVPERLCRLYAGISHKRTHYCRFGRKWRYHECCFDPFVAAGLKSITVPKRMTSTFEVISIARNPEYHPSLGDYVKGGRLPFPRVCRRFAYGDQFKLRGAE